MALSSLLMVQLELEVLLGGGIEAHGPAEIPDGKHARTDDGRRPITGPPGLGLGRFVAMCLGQHDWFVARCA